MAGSDVRWRRVMLVAVIMALAQPPFLATNCWLELLGGNGVLRPLLPTGVKIYSLGGAVWLLTLLLWPLTTVLVLSRLKSLARAQIESDAALRGTALLRWLLWPMARLAIGQSAILTFVLALNQFSIPVILQVPVLPEELWLAFTTRLNDRGAWAALWPLFVSATMALLVLRRAEISWPRDEGSATPRTLRRQLGNGVFVVSAILTTALLVLSVGLPLSRLALSSRTWSEVPNLLRAAPDVVVNSLLYAALPASICVGAGVVSRRIPAGPIFWLPFLIPGVLLGRAMIYAFNGTTIYGTALLVVLAFSVRYLGPGRHLMSLAYHAVDRDLMDAARMSGARGWSLFRYAYWPQLSSQAAAAWYVTYLLCLWDVETLALIYPPGGETLALRIFNLLHYGHNAQVNAQCVVLLGLAVAPLAGWMFCQWLAGWRRNG